MAMEDGYVLARALASGADPIAGLHAYEALRKERSTRVQLSSRARADSIQTTSLLARVRRDVGFKVDQWLRPAGAIRRADWIYGYDATAVPL